MKRMVGRRLVDDSKPEMALVVVVHRRFWNDEYYDEGDIGVNITTAGVLQVTTKSGTVSYSPNGWRKVASKRVPSRSKV